jgi:hypothetical protein
MLVHFLFSPHVPTYIPPFTSSFFCCISSQVMYLQMQTLSLLNNLKYQINSSNHSGPWQLKYAFLFKKLPSKYTLFSDFPLTPWINCKKSPKLKWNNYIRSPNFHIVCPQYSLFHYFVSHPSYGCYLGLDFVQFPA